MSSKNKENIIIIGSGLAAHAAGIYTSRARLNPLMFEGEMAEALQRRAVNNNN